MPAITAGYHQKDVIFCSLVKVIIKRCILNLKGATMKTNLLDKGLKVVERSGITKHAKSPEIFVGVGIGLTVLGAVSACKATLKVNDILDEQGELLVKCNKAAELNEDYAKKSLDRDKAVIAAKTGSKLIRLYSGPVILFTGGIGSILCGFNILNGRHLAMIAAYKAVDESYKTYRGRVISELGGEADKRFKHGIVKKEADIQKLDKEGNPTDKTVKKKVDTIDDGKPSEYAKFFDESCPEWTPNPIANLDILRLKETVATDMLQARGHLFLNEVYDLLGIPRTEAGTAVGWKLGMGEDVVDFGIYNLYSDAGRRFVNGLEPVILLDFNVDGPIYDKIEEA